MSSCLDTLLEVSQETLDNYLGPLRIRCQRDKNLGDLGGTGQAPNRQEFEARNRRRASKRERSLRAKDVAKQSATKACIGDCLVVPE
ncbi:MAG: hypothetical protein RBU37_24900 [Myxococcota bacterium]|nr:hypothetical protein [Myxococcota bacterium]